MRCEEGEGRRGKGRVWRQAKISALEQTEWCFSLPFPQTLPFPLLSSSFLFPPAGTRNQEPGTTSRGLRHYLFFFNFHVAVECFGRLFSICNRKTFDELEWEVEWKCQKQVSRKKSWDGDYLCSFRLPHHQLHPKKKEEEKESGFLTHACIIPASSLPTAAGP